MHCFTEAGDCLSIHRDILKTLPTDLFLVQSQFPEEMRAHELDLGLVVNILKGAIATSDRVLTVSEGYAKEIITPEGGKGLEAMLETRVNRLDGVVNGIDMDEWNPAQDEFTSSPFDVSDLSGKMECKRKLQQEMGLEVRDDVPLIGFIGRLDWQKGPDLIRDSIADMMNEDVQVIMLGVCPSIAIYSRLSRLTFFSYNHSSRRRCARTSSIWVWWLIS